MRNRTISGLSLGTIVIEAADRSGTFITAKHALEQNREVFAIPGAIGSPTSGGVHRLIQEGAKLTTGVHDVIEELRPEIRQRLSQYPSQGETAGVGPGTHVTPEPVELVGPVEKDEQIVFNILRDAGPADPDQLVELAGIATERVIAALVGLQLKGIVRSFPGGFYSVKQA
jgi:DNA processing protein